MTYLYDFFIRPIEYLIEVIFDVLYGKLHHPGFAIIGVSLTVSLLTLPLYNRSEAIQQQERKKQKAMSAWTNHIKKTFRGDEQYMMLSAYYRENHYHPVYALRSMFSLLLQIPFFIAAYHFLSHLELLEGVRFGFIQNLGLPDETFHLGGYAVNVLPILMTGINLVSSAVYLREYGKREKVQLCVTALVFLVLLYRSPSGLVLYWTSNNLFSLCKNLIFTVSGNRSQKANSSGQRQDYLFWGAAFVLFFLSILIPATVIASDPVAFAEIALGKGPGQYLVHIAVISAGTFLLWGGILYFLTGEKLRSVAVCLAITAAGVALLNYLGVSDNPEFGRLNSLMLFPREPFYTSSQKYGNIMALFIMAVLIIVLFIRYRKVLLSFSFIVAGSLMILCLVRVVSIRSVMKGVLPKDPLPLEDELYGVIPLDRTGKNVIVIMMDRAINGMFPYILEERKELQSAFEGFVYYPNTISFARSTSMGSPAVYGGYEYTPAAMNSRTDRLLVDKHNEALCLLPRLFSERGGYRVTVTDPPYANYNDYPDLTVYEDYEGIAAYRLSGAFSDTDFGDEAYDDLRIHNLFFYSLFRMVPTIVKNDIYDEGTYRRISDGANYILGDYKSDYPVIKHLRDICRVSEDGVNTFWMMTSEATHVDGSVKLQLPDYEPALIVDNSAYDLTSRTDAEGNQLDLTDAYDHYIDGDRVLHYTANASVWIQVGKWLDWMKEEGVYDNTRIIIVSDHGADLALFPEVSKVDISRVNAFLAVKDFDAHGKPMPSNEFMTNADVPSIALRGLIVDPTNPYTEKVINSDEKTEHPQEITMSWNWHPDKNACVWDTSDNVWFTVHDDIFQDENWELKE